MSSISRYISPAPSARLLTAVAFLAFFVFGFVDNLKGPTLPVILRDLDFSYSLGGSLLFGAYLGFLIATLVTGLLADLMGHKLILLLAGACITVGLLLFGVSASFWGLAAAFTVVGLGIGAIEVGANALIVEVHQAQRGRFLNLLAVFHGIGSLIVPLYAAQLLRIGTPWRQVYGSGLFLAVALIALTLIARFPPRAPGTGGGVNFKSLRRAGFTGNMALYYLLVAVYVAAELGVAAWIVEFLQATKGLSLGLSSIYLSLFFACIMLGRLAGSYIVDRIGYLRVMLAAAVASIVFMSVGIYGPPALAFMVPATGLFFSIIFPTTTAAVSQRHQENRGAILGLLFAFGGLGGAIGPWSVGVASDWLGVQHGFAVTIGYCIVTTLALVALRRTERHAGSYPAALQQS